jgi:hypothetical protein
MGKALCRLFFGASKKSVQQTSGWNIRLEKCSLETNYANTTFLITTTLKTVNFNYRLSPK